MKCLNSGCRDILYLDVASENYDCPTVDLTNIREAVGEGEYGNRCTIDLNCRNKATTTVWWGEYSMRRACKIHHN